MFSNLFSKLLSVVLFFSPQTVIRNNVGLRGNATLGASSFELVSFQGSPDTFEVFRGGDLTTWTKPATTYDCSSVVRDPSIMKYAGTYFLIHTDTCTPGQTAVIAWSKASDALTWQNHSDIALRSLGLPSSTFAWAPEWFLDPNATGLSSVHVILAVDSLLYEIHPTSADFSTWSNVVAIPVTGVSSLIDPFWVYRAGTYYVWYKLQDGSCNIQYASSSTLLGTYTNVKTGNWAGFVNNGCVEGPSLIKNLTGGWRIFLDLDHNDLFAGQINYSDSADDWATWTAISPIFTPNQAKHGTAIRLP